MDEAWTGTVVIETPRLRLRTYRESDLAPLAAMSADPEVMRYLGGVRSAAHVAERARASEAHHRATGLGFLPIERRADGAFLGLAGVSPVEWYPDDLEVGWRLHPDHRGRGYATEAGAAWIDRAFALTDAPRVISVADVPNRASHAVMERLGMRRDHVALLRDGEEDFEAAVYALTRAEWEASRTARPEAPPPA